jgi:hypothetical protein
MIQLILEAPGAALLKAALLPFPLGLAGAVAEDWLIRQKNLMKLDSLIQYGGKAKFSFRKHEALAVSFLCQQQHSQETMIIAARLSAQVKI